LQIESGPATLTLEYRSGGVFQGDWIELIPVTAVEGTAWSAVKQLFR
jgi:hypothetical protein